MKPLKTYLLLWLSVWQFTVFAQDSTPITEQVFKENLRTVRLHIPNSPLSYPILALNSGAQLELYFDDIDAVVKDYSYTIQLCNQDWTPSALTEMDYTRGFTEADIRDFDFSQLTKTNFVNYSVLLPNQDIGWTKSGNYALKVYENTDNGKKELVIVKRFVVVENWGKIRESITFPGDAAKRKSHQEVDFTFLLKKGVELQRPLNDLSATILQNGRWETAIHNILPMHALNGVIDFNYQNKIVFPASKEWRWADVRSFEKTTSTVATIDEYDDAVEILLYPDHKRTYKEHLNRIDINGKYVIQNADRFQSFSSTNLLNDNNQVEAPSFTFVNRNDATTNNLQGDYALVYFALESPTEYHDADIYIYGALSDWTLKEEFKMTYSPKHQGYVGEVWLKQGYYDYMYAYAPKGSTKINLSELEGDSFQTKNDYTILLYYRPFGQDYDRVIAVHHCHSGI